MALRDKVFGDNRGLYQNREHFSEEHSWNGVPLFCVCDGETAMRRKNHNAIDISWDNNTSEVTIYVPEKDFPGRAQTGEQGFFDRRPFKMLQVQNDMGMLTITLVTYEQKAVLV